MTKTKKAATDTKPSEKKTAKKKPPTNPTTETTPVEETKPQPAKAETPKTDEKKPTTPGVRAMRTRPYVAGVIIAKHGLAAGVTPDMVTELDKEYGHENPAESLFCLRNAWHSARGFSGLDADVAVTK